MWSKLSGQNTLTYYIYTLNYMNLTNIYRTLNSTWAEYTFFSRTDHMIGHKTSLCKFKKITAIPSIFPNYNDMKVEIKYKKKTERSQYVKIKQHTPEQAMGQKKNQKRKL